MVNPFNTEDQERYNLEIRMARDLEERFTYLQSQIDIINAESAERPDFKVPPNYLPNSHPEWSKDAWLNSSITSATISDDNCECYNWYRQLGVYDSSPANVAVSDAAALKREHPTNQHSLWGAPNEATNADIPRWDGTNGLITLGGVTNNYDIACPLPKDVISPGQNYFVTVEVQNTNGSTPADMEFYCGFWDKAANDWIRGSTFTPTLAIFGAAGVRTLNYRVYAETESGEQLRSGTITTTTAPSTLTPDNHVRISFSGAAGFTKYDIYRDDGTNVYHVGSVRNSIDLEFFDLAETGDTVVRYAATTVFPTVTDTAPSAMAQTNNFAPGSSGFTNHTLRIRVPTTYDRSGVVAGDQWFRFGLTGLMGTGDEREISIRKIGLSEGFGGWTRASADSSDPQSAPTMSASSAPEPSYPLPDPPDRGTGGDSTCVALETRIEVIDKTTRPTSIPMAEVERGTLINYGPCVSKVTDTLVGRVSSVLVITTEGGLELTCSKSHRLLRSELDYRGTAARRLSVGDQVLTYVKGGFRRDIIDTIEEVIGERTVKSITVPKPHLYIANGFVSHNYKDPDEV